MPQEQTQAATPVEEVVVTGIKPDKEPAKYHGTSIRGTFNDVVGNIITLNPSGAANALGNFGARAVADATNGYGQRSGDFTPGMARRAKAYDASHQDPKGVLSGVFTSAAGGRIQDQITNLNPGVKFAVRVGEGAAQGTKAELDLSDAHRKNIADLATKEVPGYVHKEVTLPNGKTAEIWVDASEIPAHPSAEPVLYSTDNSLKGKVGQVYKDYAASEALKYTEKLQPPVIPHDTIEAYIGEGVKLEDLPADQVKEAQDNMARNNKEADETNEANQDPDVVRQYQADQYNNRIDGAMKATASAPALPKQEIAQNAAPSSVTAPSLAPAV